MKKHFFAADAHLDPVTKPQIWNNFLSFLDYVEKEQGDLYILGDLFNYWINKNFVIDKYQPVLEKLSKIGQSSNVCFLPGNRDFLLREKFLSIYGINYLPDQSNIKIDSLRVLLTHGDDFWDQNRSYSLYKKFGWPLLAFLDFILPSFGAEKVAEIIRGKSKRHKKCCKNSVHFLNENLVNNYFQNGIDLIICGHIHKQDIKNFADKKQMIVLPEWKAEGGGYAILEDDAVKLFNYP